MAHKTPAAAKLKIFVLGDFFWKPHFENTSASFSLPFIVALMHGNLVLIHSS
jgi:hypothetical protein